MKLAHDCPTMFFVHLVLLLQLSSSNFQVGKRVEMLHLYMYLLRNASISCGLSIVTAVCVCNAVQPKATWTNCLSLSHYLSVVLHVVIIAADLLLFLA